MKKILTDRRAIMILAGVTLLLILLFFGVKVIGRIFDPSQSGGLFSENGKGSLTSEVIFQGGAPAGLLILPDGALFIADSYNKTIWELNVESSPRVYAGRQGVVGVGGVPHGGYNDAELHDSAFGAPRALAGYFGGYLVCDTLNNVIRFFNSERVQTFVGNGNEGYEDGKGNTAEFRRPGGIATDGEGNVYIADTGNHVIRKVNFEGEVSTYAGSTEGCAVGELGSAAFRSPTGLYWHDGALYVADSGNHRILKISDGLVSVVAGPRDNPPSWGETYEDGGYIDGSVTDAMFSGPQGVAVSDSGDIYVADTGNHAIRKISGGQVSTFCVIDMDVAEFYPVSPVCVVAVGDILYVADEFAGVVFCRFIG